MIRIPRVRVPIRIFSTFREIEKMGFKERFRLIQEEIDKHPLLYKSRTHHSWNEWSRGRESLFNLMRQPDKYASEIKEAIETLRNQEMTLLYDLQQRTSEEKELIGLEMMQHKWDKNRICQEHGMSPEEFREMSRKK